jgi:hypothetical protein
MVRAHVAQMEGMAREKVVLPATIHDEAAGATQRVSILGDELATTFKAKDAAEDNISSLAAISGHKMHIFTANIPIFHSRYRR